MFFSIIFYFYNFTILCFYFIYLFIIGRSRLVSFSSFFVPVSFFFYLHFVYLFIYKQEKQSRCIFFIFRSCFHFLFHFSFLFDLFIFIFTYFIAYLLFFFSSIFFYFFVNLEEKWFLRIKNFRLV